MYVHVVIIQPAMDPHISVEMDTSNAPATNHSAESTLPGTVYAVVTTADRVKVCRHTYILNL